MARLIDEFADECRLAESAAAIPFAVLRQVLNAAASEATRAVARLAEGRHRWPVGSWTDPSSQSGLRGRHER